MQFWQNLVNEFFDQEALYRTTLWDKSDVSQAQEICMPILARYFWMQFNSGVERMQICINEPQQRDMNNGGFLVESNRCTFTYWYENSSQVSLVSRTLALERH